MALSLNMFCLTVFIPYFCSVSSYQCERQIEKREPPGVFGDHRYEGWEYQFNNPQNTEIRDVTPMDAVSFRPQTPINCFVTSVPRIANSFVIRIPEILSVSSKQSTTLNDAIQSNSSILLVSSPSIKGKVNKELCFGGAGTCDSSSVQKWLNLILHSTPSASLNSKYMLIELLLLILLLSACSTSAYATAAFKFDGPVPFQLPRFSWKMKIFGHNKSNVIKEFVVGIPRRFPTNTRKMILFLLMMTTVTSQSTGIWSV